MDEPFELPRLPYDAVQTAECENQYLGMVIDQQLTGVGLPSSRLLLENLGDINTNVLSLEELHLIHWAIRRVMIRFLDRPEGEVDAFEWWSDPKPHQLEEDESEDAPAGPVRYQLLRLRIIHRHVCAAIAQQEERERFSPRAA